MRLTGPRQRRPPARKPSATHAANAFFIGLVAGAWLSFAAIGKLQAKPVLGSDHEPSRRPGPPGRWRAVLARGVKAFTTDRLPATAAGVTFFMLMALIPALSAFISLYGLFADVNNARAQMTTLTGLLPGGAISVLTDQIARLTSLNHGRLGATFAVSFIVSLWSANAGLKALIDGLNIAYGARERRGFIALNLVSLGFTLGAVVLAAVALAFVVSAPEILANLRVPQLAPASLIRWPALMLLTSGLFALFYRYGASRRWPRWRWTVPGACAGAAGWLLMSGLFSWYVANFGHYDRTYGSLGAIIGFLTWIWLSVMTVLFGAELNAELEQQATTEIDEVAIDDHGVRRPRTR